MKVLWKNTPRFELANDLNFHRHMHRCWKNPIREVLNPQPFSSLLWVRKQAIPTSPLVLQAC